MGVLELYLNLAYENKLRFGMQLNGVWWFIILLVVVVILYIFAKYRQGSQTDNKSIKKTATLKQNGPLVKLHNKLKNKDADFNYYLRDNHILVSQTKNGDQQKIAMITLDKNKAAEVRKLGEVSVLNFDHQPTAQRVKQMIKELV